MHTYVMLYTPTPLLFQWSSLHILHVFIASYHVHIKHAHDKPIFHRAATIEQGDPVVTSTQARGRGAFAIAHGRAKGKLSTSRTSYAEEEDVDDNNLYVASYNPSPQESPSASPTPSTTPSPTPSPDDAHDTGKAPAKNFDDAAEKDAEVAEPRKSSDTATASDSVTVRGPLPSHSTTTNRIKVTRVSTSSPP
jgi:predicted Zn-dependent protease